MKKTGLVTIIIGLSFTFCWTLPAFPGAEGWGSTTTGGRGGKVYVVTTTASSGAGSFAAALTASGVRTIVFRVSGTISVGSNIELRGPQSKFTIAGQTSPGGITLRGAGESFWFNYNNPMTDMIIRFLRFRQGDSGNHGLMMAGISNVVFDHGIIRDNAGPANC
jgi:hypothetical protein